MRARETFHVVHEHHRARHIIRELQMRVSPGRRGARELLRVAELGGVVAAPRREFARRHRVSVLDEALNHRAAQVLVLPGVSQRRLRLALGHHARDGRLEVSLFDERKRLLQAKLDGGVPSRAKSRVFVRRHARLHEPGVVRRVAVRHELGREREALFGDERVDDVATGEPFESEVRGERRGWRVATLAEEPIDVRLERRRG